MSIYDVMSMDGIVSKRQLKSEQKCNKEYIMSVLNEGENIYPLICDELKKDDDIAKIAIQMNYTNNYSVYRKLVFNPSLEMMLLALKNFPYNIFPHEYIYKIIFYSSRYNEYKKTIFSSNFIHNKQKSDFFEFIENPDLPIEQKTFDETMEKYNASLTSKGEIIISMCISELFKEHINHYEICEAIVKANGQFFSYLDYKYHQDKNLALIAVKSNGLIYQSLSEELKKDDEIIFHALMNDFIVYNFLPKEHKRNKDLMRKIFVHKGIELLAENKYKIPNSSQLPEKASIEDYTDFLMIGIYAPRRKYVVLFVEEKLAEKIFEEERDFFGYESPSDFIHEQGILFEEFKESVIGTFWLDDGFNINHHGITVNYKTLNKSGHISMESNGDPKDKTHIFLNRSLDSEIKSLIDEHNIPSNFHHLIIYDEISYNAHLVLGLPLEEELNKPLKIILYGDAVLVNDYKLSEDSNLIDLMHTDDRMTDSTYLQSIDGKFYAELEEIW